MSEEEAKAWFYEHVGTKRGPVTIEVLRTLLASGEVAATARVWNKREADGVPADRVPQLCFLEDIDRILAGQQHPGAARSIIPPAVRMRCRCGKRLRIPKDAAGRRIRCPNCGEAFDAPLPDAGEAQPVSTPKSRGPADPGTHFRRMTNVIPWVGVFLLVAAGVGFVVWLFNQDLSARQKRANDNVALAIADAEVWLAEGADADQSDGQKRQELLRFALQAPEVTSRSEGDEAVVRVSRRLGEMTAVRAAEKLFSDANALLDQGDLEGAMQKMTSNEGAAAVKHRPEATALLAQIRSATDELAMRGWLQSQGDAALRAIRESKDSTFGGVSHPVLRVKQGLLAAEVAERILGERAKARVVHEAKTLEKEQASVDRTAKDAVVQGTLAAATGDSPKGFRGLAWGDPPLPDMRPKPQTRYDAARGVFEYTKPNERLQIGNVPIKSLTYDFRDGRFVAVTLSVLGNNKEFREIVESQFGPFEMVTKPRNTRGWPFNPLTGVPLDGFAKKYASDARSVVCVLDVDNGIGTTILLRLMESEEAKRLDQIRQRIMEEGGRDF